MKYVVEPQRDEFKDMDRDEYIHRMHHEPNGETRFIACDAASAEHFAVFAIGSDGEAALCGDFKSPDDAIAFARGEAILDEYFGGRLPDAIMQDGTVVDFKITLEPADLSGASVFDAIDDDSQAKRYTTWHKITAPGFKMRLCEKAHAALLANKRLQKLLKARLAVGRSSVRPSAHALHYMEIYYPEFAR